MRSEHPHPPQRDDRGLGSSGTRVLVPEGPISDAAIIDAPGIDQRTQPNRNRALLSNTMWRLMQVIGGGGFSGLILLLYTIAMPKSDYGIYGVATSVAFLFQMFGEFGLRQTVTRFVARERGAGRLGRARAYVVATLRLSPMLATTVALIFVGVALSLPNYFGAWPRALVPLVAFYVATKSVSFILQGAAEGASRFKAVSTTSLALNLVQLAIVAPLCLTGLDIVKVMAVEAGIALLSLGAYGYPVWRMLVESPRGEAPTRITRELIWFALPLLINAFGGFLYTRVDMLFIHGYVTLEDAADYYLMTSLQRFPLLAIGSYIYVLNTDVAHAYGAGDFARILTLFRRSVLYAAGVGTVLAAVFFASSWIVPIVLPAYSGAMVLMRLAAPLFIVKCAAQVVSGAFMVSLGRPGLMAAFTVAGGVMNVILDFALIPAYGAAGSVYATLIGHSLIGISVMLYAFRDLRQLDRLHQAKERT